MRVDIANLEDCHLASGIVIVIDVCRAFTTAPFAFSAGASEILLVSTVEEAFALRDLLADTLIMGEVGGLPVQGFDYGNSPNEFSGIDLTGRRLIQRTSAGTQGVVRSSQANVLLTGSFVVAGATARYVRQIASDRVTLVTTGWRSARPADEDAACADYLAELMAGRSTDPSPYLERARKWLETLDTRQIDPAMLPGLQQDLERCLEVDRFGFAMRVERRDGLLVMQPIGA